MMVDDEKLLEAVLDFANGIEAVAFSLKKSLSKIVGVEDVEVFEVAEVKEEDFQSLKWITKHGERIGDFETAQHCPDYDACLKILKKHKATIGSKLSKPKWRHRYWYWQSSIFRQLKKKTY